MAHGFSFGGVVNAYMAVQAQQHDRIPYVRPLLHGQFKD
jgi:hypothetical protein